jgi:hypothetical protein
LRDAPAAQNEGAPENSVFVRRGILDRGIKEMRASHRHPARVSATLLPKDSSLYDAIRAIIGSELRSKLDVPKVMPSYLDDLLKELEKRLGSDQKRPIAALVTNSFAQVRISHFAIQLFGTGAVA